MKRKQDKGFTLIELMCTVAVIGILSAIVLPSYDSAIKKVRRAEGRVAVLALLLQQESYMSQTNSYFAIDAPGATGIPFKTFSGDNPSKSAYLLKAQACSEALQLNACVKVLAVPVKDDPEAGTLYMTSSGALGCTGTQPGNCW